MLFGDVLAIALSIIGFLLSLQGLWLVCRALWPGRVEAATAWCGAAGLRCFLVGLPVSAVTIVAAAVVAKTFGTFGQLSGFSLAMLYVVYANLGTAGFVTHVGRRLASPADGDRPWKATIRGGAALELAWLIPILGWFGLMPISLILGAGATTLALFGLPRRGNASAAPLPAPALAPAQAPAVAPAAAVSPPMPAPLPIPAIVPPLPKPQRTRTPAQVPTQAPAELEPAEPAGVEG